MGAVAEGARRRNGRTIGVIPKALVHRELADVEADELVVTDTMRERKQVMEERADAFIALPGGIGTLEEFFEAWTAGYLGMHDKPVVMLDPIGHYDGLLAWLHGLVDSGYVAEGALDRLVVVSDVDVAMSVCAPPQWHRSLGCATTKQWRGHIAHERPEVGDSQQRRAARHRQPCAGSVDGPANHLERCGHWLRGPPDRQDLHRQGVPGARC